MNIFFEFKNKKLQNGKEDGEKGGWTTWRRTSKVWMSGDGDMWHRTKENGDKG